MRLYRPKGARQVSMFTDRRTYQHFAILRRPRSHRIAIPNFLSVFIFFDASVVTHATIAEAQSLSAYVVSRTVIIVGIVECVTVLRAIPALCVGCFVWSWGNRRAFPNKTLLEPSTLHGKATVRRCCGTKEQFLLKRVVHAENTRNWCRLAWKCFMVNVASICTREPSGNFCNVSSINGDTIAGTQIGMIPNGCAVRRIPRSHGMRGSAFRLQLVETFRTNVAIWHRRRLCGGVRTWWHFLRPQGQSGCRR